MAIKRPKSISIDALIQIIDQRIDQKLAHSNLVRKYSGVIVENAQNNTMAQVQLLGYDTIFTMPNKTGQAVTKGQLVKIETCGWDLTNGFISEVCGHDN